MDSAVKRRDTTKGPPLRILSLDGGGVRGYSMLIIIQDLMHRTFVELHGRAPRRHEIPKPADHFDLIVGTGTGGLIALMLGRLRLDLEICKELYADLTRYVFERDKRIIGIPFRSTIFKASRLEEAICSAVKKHTVDMSEGNDGTAPAPNNTNSAGPRRHVSNASVVSFSARSPQNPGPVVFTGCYSKYGDANARLYDPRENRTKTAVLATYRGSSFNGSAVLLRSYDSRREPPPEFDCKIWEAGRATCAIGMAFKPVQIGQSWFHDDGVGHFNPAPDALDEAVVNEWPGREVGVFISVGTGKRPQSGKREEWYDGFMVDVADYRRKLISKIENCEAIHNKMKTEYLPNKGVNVENYFRFNAEVGVGEFGMNEWNRLADISTGTRRYLGREKERKQVINAASKLARIKKAIARHNRALSEASQWANSIGSSKIILPRTASDALDEVPVNVMELPAEVPQDWASPDHSPAPSRRSYESEAGSHRFNVTSPKDSSDRIRVDSSHSSSYDRGHSPSTASYTTAPLSAGPLSPVSPVNGLVPAPLSPQNYRTTNGSDIIAIISPDEEPLNRSGESEGMIPITSLYEDGPPVPPKTPFRDQAMTPPRGNFILPYPDDDVDMMPPEVHMDRKPRYTR